MKENFLFDRPTFPEKLNKVICNYSKKRHIELPCLLKRFPLEVCGYLPYEQAQVCSGGVDTSEIDPHTMESRLCPGLYFAGELMDVDGTCGGYNLQWAWSQRCLCRTSQCRSNR